MTEVEQLQWQLKRAHEDYDDLRKAYLREQQHSSELAKCIGELNDTIDAMRRPDASPGWFMSEDEVSF